jgi:Uncharacterized conserved protein, contains double-stranded beta-helix domain
MSKQRFEFPEAIKALSLADVPLDGCTAYMVQGENEQVLFMEFAKDAILPEHSHEAQWGVILSGEIELVINGKKHKYKKGDSYYIPKGVNHSGKIFAGYCDVTYFNQKERYKKK